MMAEMAVTFHVIVSLYFTVQRGREMYLSETSQRREKMVSSQTPSKVSLGIIGPDWVTGSHLDQSL